MITHKELARDLLPEDLALKVVLATEDYEGQIDHFYEVVGMIVVGRLVGWKVMRLVSSRRCWDLASKLFGDPKELMPERGQYAYRSVGLAIIDRIGGYWDIISGKASRDEIPLLERKMIK